MDYNNNRFNAPYPHQVPAYPYPSPNSNELRKNSDDYKDDGDKDLTMAAIDKVGGRDTFVESILRNSIGTKATLYYSYPDSDKWHDVVYDGTILLIGEDYIIIADSATNKIVVLLMLYLNWVEYDYGDGKGNWYKNFKKA